MNTGYLMELGDTTVDNFQAVGGSTQNFMNQYGHGNTVVHNLSALGGSVQNFGLMEMPTNIGSLRTRGHLNSHANRWTTTNVGHMAGDSNSVISLSELNWFTNAGATLKKAILRLVQMTKTEAAAIIKAATPFVHSEAVKLANQLITDVEA
jgi:hypothetical protein